MKVIKRKILFIQLLLIFIYGILSAQITENVFIVVIDGPRYSETFGDSTHKNIPVMWNILKPLGTIFSPLYLDFHLYLL